MSRAPQLPVLGLCALLAGSGVLHFVIPAPYRRIVPAPLRRYAAVIVALSGVCELVCAALLAVPPSRRLGATATAALFIAVFPANVQMALASNRPDGPFSVQRAAAAWLRLPLQLPLVLWALGIRRVSHGAEKVE